MFGWVSSVCRLIILFMLLLMMEVDFGLGRVCRVVFISGLIVFVRKWM